MNCPFWQIDTEKSRVLFEGDSACALLSNPRLMTGHSPVIPKRHVENPGKLTENELVEIFQFVSRVRDKLFQNGATGVDVRQNYRPFLAQSKTKVDHVHFHVLPRTLEDELYVKSMKYEVDIFKDLPDDERERMTLLLGEK